MQFLQKYVYKIKKMLHLTVFFFKFHNRGKDLKKQIQKIKQSHM